MAGPKRAAQVDGFAHSASPQITELLAQYPLRELVTRGEQYGVWVDRPPARFGSWYEMFPRSTGGWDAEGNPVHGTFATAAAALPRIAKMGFDVLISIWGHINFIHLNILIQESSNKHHQRFQYS